MPASPSSTFKRIEGRNGTYILPHWAHLDPQDVERDARRGITNASLLSTQPVDEDHPATTVLNCTIKARSLLQAKKIIDQINQEKPGTLSLHPKADFAVAGRGRFSIRRVAILNENLPWLGENPRLIITR